MRKTRGGAALGVGECAPRQLREGGAWYVRSRHHHPEAVLLAVGGVEDVVGDGKNNDESDEEVGVHVDWRVVVDVNGLGAINKRNAGCIPPAKHPAEVLEKNVPGRGHLMNTFN